MSTEPKHSRELIELVAPTLGVKAAALKKWRQRGVPHRWRLPLMEKSDGKITADMFSVFPIRPEREAQQ